MKTILFVGECRSLTAIRNGWRWQDGRLAAKTLFDALRALGIDPEAHEFVNLWTDPPAAPRITWHRKARLRATASLGEKIIVALGKKVSDKLAELKVDHVALIHPAARGRIRGRGRYARHVAEKLGPEVRS